LIVTVGAVVSCTVIVNELEPVLPSLSVAEQVTVVIAIGKVEPEGGVQVGVRGPSIESLADAVNVITFPLGLVASSVMFAGTVTTGAVVSSTVIVNELEPVLLALSVTEQVTFVVPMGKTEPDAGTQVGVRVPSTMSVADAVKVIVFPLVLVASWVMFAGTVTVGAVVSCTVMVNELEPVLPALSVTEQVTVVVAIGKVEPEGGVQVGVREPSTMSVADAVKVIVFPLALVAS
jgi:hypothetical protein